MSAGQPLTGFNTIAKNYTKKNRIAEIIQNKNDNI